MAAMNQSTVSLHPQKFMEAIVFVAWGEKPLAQARRCLTMSNSEAMRRDKILVTDDTANTSSIESHFSAVIRLADNKEVLLFKASFYDHLPEGHSCYLYLDADTIVSRDISFGFLKAKQFGIAIASALHCSLEIFWGHDKLM
jgi:hypothetical protein